MLDPAPLPPPGTPRQLPEIITISPPVRLPDFIGIGALKAGTTWLAEQLARHPQVFLPAIKETHFFAYPYAEYPFSHYGSFFAGAAPGQRAGEFSADYLATPEVPARIARHLPDVRLLVVFRHPVELVQSNYWHLRRQNFQCNDPGRPDLATALRRHARLLRDPALQGAHLQRWLTHFPRERILVLWHEDLRTVSARVLEETFRFIGVDPAFRPAAAPQERAGVSPRSALGARLYAQLYQFAVVRVLYGPIRLWRYDTALRFVHRLRLRQIAERLFFRKGYPAMDAGLRRSLAAEFRDDVALLERLTGRDLTAWKQ